MSSAYQDLAEKIYKLEKRVTQLESEINLVKAAEETKYVEIKTSGSDEEKIESTIGEYGLAWLGNIVLFFGIIFFVEYLKISGYNKISALFGFVAVTGIFLLARYFRNSYSFMAKIFDLNGFLLIFYITSKLHFFTDNPIIDKKAAAIVMLLLICAAFLFISIKNRNSVIAGLSLVLISVSGLFSDSTHLMLSLTVLSSVAGFLFLYRYGWIRIAYLSIFLVYVIHLLWIFGNPIMGNSLQIIQNHQWGFIYLFLSGAIFSLIALQPAKQSSYSADDIVGAVIINGLGFSFMLGIFCLSFFNESYYLILTAVALAFILYSVILNLFSPWKITGALYALAGFVALSTAIYGLFGFPAAFSLLAFQSLLVVSIAIFFRSRFIVVMNIIMYIILLCIYLLTSEPHNLVNISFSLVAFATARMLNWKKKHLTIRTDLIRNTYLIILFFMVLYTLYHMISKEFISLSWIMAGLIYFLLSFLLKNRKYRYMAISNMVLAALYLFLVDLSRIELIYRVIAFLSLSMISIGLSLYYKKTRKEPNIQS